MPAGMPAAGRNMWSDSDEKLLLLLYGLKQGDWNWIAEKMGATYSISAIAQKHGKLMRAAEAKYGKIRGTENSTPVKRPRAKAAGSNKQSQTVEEGDSDDEVPQTKTPSKRPRATAATSTKKSKAPTGQDGEIGDGSNDNLHFKTPTKKIKTFTEEPFFVKPDPGLHDVDNEDLYDY